MSDMVTAPEYGGIVGGGSAGGGNYVLLTIRLGDKNQPMLIEKSKVGSLMLGLATAAAMARSDRLAVNPLEETDGLDSAYALEVKRATVGRSTDGETGVLDLRVDADMGREMNLFIAAKAPALESILNACGRALELLKQPKRKQRAN